MALSDTSWYCIETDDRIELAFGTEATLCLCYTKLEENLGMYEKRYFLLEFYIPNSEDL